MDWTAEYTQPRQCIFGVASPAVGFPRGSWDWHQSENDEALVFVADAPRQRGQTLWARRPRQQLLPPDLKELGLEGMRSQSLTTPRHLGMPRQDCKGLGEGLRERRRSRLRPWRSRRRCSDLAMGRFTATGCPSLHPSGLQPRPGDRPRDSILASPCPVVTAPKCLAAAAFTSICCSCFDGARQMGEGMVRPCPPTTARTLHTRMYPPRYRYLEELDRHGQRTTGVPVEGANLQASWHYPITRYMNVTAPALAAWTSTEGSTSNRSEEALQKPPVPRRSWHRRPRRSYRSPQPTTTSTPLSFHVSGS